MAISTQKVPDGEDVWGRMRVRFVDITLDSAYPNPAGYVVNASDLGMKMVYSVDLAGQNTAAESYLYTFNMNSFVGSATITGVPATSFAIRVFTAAGTQYTNGSSLSTVTIRLCVIGR